MLSLFQGGTYEERSIHCNFMLYNSSDFNGMFRRHFNGNVICGDIFSDNGAHSFNGRFNRKFCGNFN